MLPVVVLGHSVKKNDANVNNVAMNDDDDFFSLLNYNEHYILAILSLGINIIASWSSIFLCFLLVIFYIVR